MATTYPNGWRLHVFEAFYISVTPQDIKVIMDTCIGNCKWAHITEMNDRYAIEVIDQNKMLPIKSVGEDDIVKGIERYVHDISVTPEDILSYVGAGEFRIYSEAEMPVACDRILQYAVYGCVVNHDLQFKIYPSAAIRELQSGRWMDNATINALRTGGFE